MSRPPPLPPAVRFSAFVAFAALCGAGTVILFVMVFPVLVRWFS